MRRGTAIAAASLALATVVAIAWRAGALPFGGMGDDATTPAKPPATLDPADENAKPVGLAARPAPGDAKPVVDPRAQVATTADEKTGVAYRALVVDEEGTPLRGVVVRADTTQRQPVTIVGDASPVSDVNGHVTLTVDARTADRHLWARATLADRVQQ